MEQRIKIQGLCRDPHPSHTRDSHNQALMFVAGLLSTRAGAEQRRKKKKAFWRSPGATA